jgi:hypothetical protein
MIGKHYNIISKKTMGFLSTCLFHWRYPNLRFEVVTYRTILCGSKDLLELKTICLRCLHFLNYLQRHSRDVVADS